VGASTRTRGELVRRELRGGGAVRAIRSRAGSTNAAVLPVPVCAAPMTSRPPISAGIACAWIGVGAG
jgi:hypothetical protein